MFFLNINSVILVLLTILTFCYYVFQKRRKLPPGPYGYPYIGIFHLLKQNPHETLACLAEKYGDIFSFKMLGKTYIHLNTLEVMKEAFNLKAQYFNGRENVFSLLNFWDDGGGISQVEGEIWKEDRRFFLQNVKNFGFGRTELEPHIHKITRNLLTILHETKENPTGAVLPICYATISTSGKVFMSLEYDNIDDPEFIYITDNAFSIIREFMTARMLAAGYIYKYLLFQWLSPFYDELILAKAAFYKIADKIIEDHTKTFDKNNIRDFTDKMLEKMFEQQQNHETNFNPITHEKIRGLIVNIFVDGMLSTTTTINGFLQTLALNEDVQTTVQKEIDDVIGTHRLPSWADRNKLPYTEATLLELHRTSTPFPLSVLHTCTETGEMNGYHIPKDAIIVPNLWSIHNDPRQWKNPEIFDPTRFLSGDDKRKNKDSIVTFGVGKRNCVGEPLASMEIFIFVTSILQSFDIRLPEGSNREKLQKEDEFNICFISRSS